MSSQTGKKIEDLYFGICIWDSSADKLVEHNLFGSYRVRQSIALYIRDKKLRPERKEMDPLFACFNSVWSRCQFELVVDSFPESGKPQKVDAYHLYVLPNKDLLLDMVNQVSFYQAQKWLSEDRKRRKQKL